MSDRNPEVICEDCPIQQAYAEFVVQSNISEDEVDVYRIGENLTLDDFRTLKAMVTETKQATFPTWPDKARIILDDPECPGPKRTIFTLGRLECRGVIDFIKENRHLEIPQE